VFRNNIKDNGLREEMEEFLSKNNAQINDKTTKKIKKLIHGISSTATVVTLAYIIIGIFSSILTFGLWGNFAEIGVLLIAVIVFVLFMETLKYFHVYFARKKFKKLSAK
jgi:hypothetical protein